MRICFLLALVCAFASGQALARRDYTAYGTIHLKDYGACRFELNIGNATYAPAKLALLAQPDGYLCAYLLAHDGKKIALILRDWNGPHEETQ